MTATIDRRGRRFATSVLTILACIGMLASTLGIWVNRTVFDAQRFSRTAAAAMTDPVVATALSDYIADQVLLVADERLALEERTPRLLRPLVRSTQEGLHDTISERAAELLASDGAETLLREALVRAHHVFMQVLDGHGDIVRLNLLPFISSALIALQDRSILPASLRIPEFSERGDPQEQIAELERIARHPLPATFGQLVIYRGDAASKAGPMVVTARYAIEVFHRALWGIIGVTAALVLAALAVSARRRRTVVHLGLGLAAATLAAGIFFDQVRSRLPLLVEPEYRDAARRVASHLVSSLVNLTHQLAVVGAAVALLFLVTDPTWFRGVRAEQADLAPVARRHRRGLATIAVLLALGVVAFGGISATTLGAAAAILVVFALSSIPGRRAGANR